MPRGFKFRLETVLRVRTLREREAQRKVGAKLAEIAAVDALNSETAGEIGVRQSKLLARQRGATIDPRELASERAWVNYLRRSLAERLHVKSALSRELDALRAELRQARSQMRMLEKLRERRQVEWKRDSQRREQADADELARHLLQYAAGSGGTQ